MRLKEGILVALLASFYLVPASAEEAVAVLGGQGKNDEINFIREVRLEKTGERAQVLLKGSQSPTFSVQKRKTPPGLDIDLSNSDVSALQSIVTVDSPLVRAIASTPKPQDEDQRASRISIDFTRDISYAVQARGNDLVIALGKGSLDGEVPASTGRACKIVDVSFQDREDRSQVLLKYEGKIDYHVSQHAPTTLVMDIKNASLPSGLERSLDAGAFGGPVRLISSYNADPENGLVRVVVDVGETAEQKVHGQDGILMWEFMKSLPLEQKGAPSDMSLDSDLSMTASEVDSVQSKRYRARRFRRGSSGPRINLDFKDIDIHNLLRLLAEVGHVNIVAGDDVKGTVTIMLRNVPWEQALRITLESKGLGYVREDNVIRVAPMELLEKERELELARTKVKKALKPLFVKLMPVNYATAKDLETKVKDLLSDRGTVAIDERTNTLIIKDMRENLAAAADLVRRLDTQTPQVLIEARIIEANTSFQREVGIQWGGDLNFSAANGNPTGVAFPSSIGIAGGSADQFTPLGGISTTEPNFAVNLPATTGAGLGGALGMSFGSIGNVANLNIRLSAAEQEGWIKIISAPRITTMDNREAEIQQGVSIPISVVSAQGVNTVFVDAELRLKVTPHVTTDGSIIMKIEATKNEPDFDNTGARGDPSILKKEAKTELLIRDGDTTVIGGIYTRNSSESESKVPLFGDIPVLGWLFKTASRTDKRTEMLIFITPRIVNRARSVVTSAR